MPDKCHFLLDTFHLIISDKANLYPLTAINTSLRNGSSTVETSKAERSYDLAAVGVEGVEAILEGLLCELNPLRVVEGDRDILSCTVLPVFWDGLCANRSNLAATSLLLFFNVFCGCKLEASCDIENYDKKKGDTTILSPVVN